MSRWMGHLLLSATVTSPRQRLRLNYVTAQEESGRTVMESFYGTFLANPTATMMWLISPAASAGTRSCISSITWSLAGGMTGFTILGTVGGFRGNIFLS